MPILVIGAITCTGHGSLLVAADSRHLIGVDGAPVRWIEGEDHRLTPELGQRRLLVWRGRKFEIGGLGPGRKWHRTVIETHRGHISDPLAANLQ
jgi:hypothetical protein